MQVPRRGRGRVLVLVLVAGGDLPPREALRVEGIHVVGAVCAVKAADDEHGAPVWKEQGGVSVAGARRRAGAAQLLPGRR